MSGDSLELVAAWSGLTNGIAGNSGVVIERRKRVRTRLHWPVLMFRDRSGSEAIGAIGMTGVSGIASLVAAEGWSVGFMRGLPQRKKSIDGVPILLYLGESGDFK